MQQHKPSENPKAGILDWLGLTNAPNWWVARPLGAFLGFLIVLLFLLCVLAAFSIVTATIFAASGATSNGPNLGTGALITGLLGAPFLIWRTVVAQQTVDLQREGHITDRIAKAVEQLGAEKTVKRLQETPRYKKAGDEWVRDEQGNLVPALRPDGSPIIDRETHEITIPNIEVRVGGLFALERIAQDSMTHEGGREHLTVMELLCAYIRENSPALDLKWTEPDFKRKRPRTDIQTAITILGRRSAEQRDLEARHRFRLDLRNVDLDGCDLRKGNFSAAMFHNSRFEAAFFDDSRLEGAQFFWALLNYASFRSASLIGARLDYCTLSRPRLPAAFFGSLISADLLGVSLAGADVSAASYLGGGGRLMKTFGSKDTTLSPGLEREREKIAEALDDFHTASLAEATSIGGASIDALKQSGFINWSPFSSDDLFTQHLHQEFCKSMGLTSWPYQ